MKKKVNAYEVVTQKIVDALEGGTVPWERPWSVVKQKNPTSLSSGKEYRGINYWILSLTSMIEGYSSPYWGTFNQCITRAVATAEKEGRVIEKRIGERGKSYWMEILPDGTEEFFRGGVRKGEKGTYVVLYKPNTYVKKNDDGSEEEKKGLYMQTFVVFNENQCDGLGLPVPEVVESPFTPLEQAEAVVAGMPMRPEIRHGGNRAAYDFVADYIMLPPVEQFESAEAYAATKFHELVHSTGWSERIGRDLDGFNMKPESYSKEELIAELGAAFLLTECGIATERTETQTAAYCAHWLAKLKDDRKLIVQAASAAGKAADWILDRKEVEVDLTVAPEPVMVSA